MSTQRPGLCGKMGSICNGIAAVEWLYQHSPKPPLLFASKMGWMRHKNGAWGFLEEYHREYFPARERPIMNWGLTG